MAARTIKRTHQARLVIECPNRCEGRGCQHDGSGEEWRPSTELPYGTSVDYARILLERHAERYPASGPYRLVEYVAETIETMEILEDLS